MFKWVVQKGIGNIMIFWLEIQTKMFTLCVVKIFRTILL